MACALDVFPGHGLGICQSGHGKPFHQESLQKKPIKNAAKLAGLGEGIGWHTFRHTYRSWLHETGAPMTVQQELMRHASIQTTMNVYGRAMAETKRRANSQVVGLVFGPNSQSSEEIEPAAPRYKLQLFLIGG